MAKICPRCGQKFKGRTTYCPSCLLEMLKDDIDKQRERSKKLTKTKNYDRRNTFNRTRGNGANPAG